MNLIWRNLTSLADLDTVVQESNQAPVIIYKHSTRCAVSAFVKERLEKEYAPVTDEVYYYLDLITYREISNAIAEKFSIVHQSPQIILLKKGEAVYNTSHMEILFSQLEKQLTPATQA